MPSAMTHIRAPHSPGEQGTELRMALQLPLNARLHHPHELERACGDAHPATLRGNYLFDTAHMTIGPTCRRFHVELMDEVAQWVTESGFQP